MKLSSTYGTKLQIPFCGSLTQEEEWREFAQK